MCLSFPKCILGEAGEAPGLGSVGRSELLRAATTFPNLADPLPSASQPCPYLIGTMSLISCHPSLLPVQPLSLLLSQAAGNTQLLKQRPVLLSPSPCPGPRPIEAAQNPKFKEGQTETTLRLPLPSPSAWGRSGYHGLIGASEDLSSVPDRNGSPGQPQSMHPWARGSSHPGPSFFI